MTFDFNTAGEQRSFDVVPERTVAVVQLNIRPGDAGENGILKRSKTGEAEGLDCELIIVGGPYDKRKFWEWLTVSGTTDGHAQAADISRRKLRAILESARGIKPTDVSEAAKKARVAAYADFNGIRFLAQIGVEPAKGDYRPKNFLAQIVTPERKEWQPVEQVAPPAAAAVATAKPGNVIQKPAWAS
jgi:hypothetical protein